MAPRLDLDSAPIPKVMITPSRINLRRTASYNNYERNASLGSATSSRFTINQLLFSPPPSPSLPALVPRRLHRSSAPIFTSRPSRLIRRLFLLAAFSALFYLLVSAVWNGFFMPTLLPYFLGPAIQPLPRHLLPDFPTPLVVGEGSRKPRWTVFVPPNRAFPLSMDEYATMTDTCPLVSARTTGLRHKTSPPNKHQLPPDASDEYYLDVDEAEAAGLLPAPRARPAAESSGSFVGLDSAAMASKPICDSSLTFVMESSDAGLGASLMALWTLYALAAEQGRAFFVDDSRWAYGAYGDIFQPPPTPNCRPPPRHHIVPCPAQARHLVVSAATAPDLLPALFAKHCRLTGSRGSQRDLMELARTGYRALFRLGDDDQAYVEKRIRELDGLARPMGSEWREAPIIGLHIRRGDRHPLEYQYRDTYIPVEVYLGQAERLAGLYSDYGRGRQAAADSSSRNATIIVASDDPAVHKEPELSVTMEAQKRILLASKEPRPKVETNPHVFHHFEEEEFGWEGGFFAPMFWNVGREATKSAEAESKEAAEKRSAEVLKLRSLIGRAYMMDLAVLAGASDQVVCAVSAMGCRLLAVMLGWERGIQAGAWVNVDGDYGWIGLG